MLEGVAVVLRIVIELVRVREEIIACAERITAAHVRTRKPDTLGLVDEKDGFHVAVERLTHLITDVRIRVLVRDDLYGVFHTRCTMVGRQYQGETQLGCTT